MEPTRSTDPFCSSFTTTLSWNLPGLPWPCSLGRLAALATLFCSSWGPKRSKRVTKGVCQQYLLLPLLLLLLIALLPRFHGTDQIYGPFLFLLYHHAFMEPTRSTLTVQFGPAGSSGDPFCSSWGPKRSKRVTKRVCQQYLLLPLLLLLLIALLPRFQAVFLPQWSKKLYEKSRMHRVCILPTQNSCKSYFLGRKSLGN